MPNRQPPSPQTDSASRDLTGQQIGDYRLLRRLGRGGMAEVYLAQQESLQRQVAFKVLNANLGKNDTSVRRLNLEAQAAAKLVHANIVQIYEVGTERDLHFITMEYVSGQNVRQRLTAKGPMEAGAAVAVMRQVGAALYKAGQEGIVHRDIKPENIMLSPDGEVKVADFGLARVLQGGSDSNLTQVGVTMGTPLYMSPEQAEGGAVDPRSDLYSLGVTCYHMLAGDPPFVGDSPLAIAVQHVKSPPKRLEDGRPDLPSGLCRIVHKLLEKNPDDRYQDAGEFLRELRELKIEGLDEQWPSGIEQWTTPELHAVAETQSVATQQLDALMKQDGRRSGWARYCAMIGLVSVAAFLLGAVAAWATREADLLAIGDAPALTVPQLERVEDQYLHAADVGTAQAWKAVGKYFPPEESEKNLYYWRRSTQRLAELYAEGERYEQALMLYDQLSKVEETEVNIRAFALVGKANVLVLQGKLSDAKRLLIDVVSAYPDISSNRLREELTLQLNPRLSLEFERLKRESQFRSPDN